MTGSSSVDRNPGASCQMELVIRFADWASSLPPESLTWQTIVARWSISRATAHRWRAAFRNARGLSR